MKETKAAIGFGGGCHWCTEAIFSTLQGVNKVAQGWIASKAPHKEFSEAVIVNYDQSVICLEQLIKFHLHTHSGTSNHQLRGKYRSAIYYFEQENKTRIENQLKKLQSEFEAPIITKVLPFNAFKASAESYQNYYEKDPEKPFCKIYIAPKIKRVDELISEKDHREGFGL